MEANEQLYRAIRDVSGAQVVVDSSKLPPYGFVQSQSAGVDLRCVHLVRDPRAAAYSWSRRSSTTADDGSATGPAGWLPEVGPAHSAITWTVWNVLTELLWRSDRERYLRIRYEDFVAEPRCLVAASGGTRGVCPTRRFPLSTIARSKWAWRTPRPGIRTASTAARSRFAATTSGAAASRGVTSSAWWGSHCRCSPATTTRGELVGPRQRDRRQHLVGRDPHCNRDRQCDEYGAVQGVVDHRLRRQVLPRHRSRCGTTPNRLRPRSPRMWSHRRGPSATLCSSCGALASSMPRCTPPT